MTRRINSRSIKAALVLASLDERQNGNLHPRGRGMIALAAAATASRSIRTPNLQLDPSGAEA